MEIPKSNHLRQAHTVHRLRVMASEMAHTMAQIAGELQRSGIGQATLQEMYAEMSFMTELAAEIKFLQQGEDI